jgi:hypothetical protein
MHRKSQLGAEPRREEKTTNEKGSYNFHSPLRRDYPGSWTGITTTYKVFFAPPPRGGLVLVAIQGKGAI